MGLARLGRPFDSPRPARGGNTERKKRMSIVDHMRQPLFQGRSGLGCVPGAYFETRPSSSILDPTLHKALGKAGERDDQRDSAAGGAASAGARG
jgi:hypothetical protein